MLRCGQVACSCFWSVSQRSDCDGAPLVPCTENAGMSGCGEERVNLGASVIGGDVVQQYRVQMCGSAIRSCKHAINGSSVRRQLNNQPVTVKVLLGIPLYSSCGS